MKSLIIGYGNTLRGDDAAGCRVAERLETMLDPDRFSVMIAHQLLPEMAHEIAGASRAVFIDAAENLAAGRIVITELLPDADAVRETSHSVNPAWLLYTARALFGRSPRAWSVAIGGADFAIGETMTATMTAAVEVAAGRVVDLLMEADRA